uniref:Uncharacterized protein n=1 Tax=Ciona savignyi TaxID=51511 RepID=H2Z902_CIOSA
FRFKTFSERIAEVNIDAIHRIDRVATKDDGEDFSRFFESMQKWRDLDLSVHFAAFRKQIVDKCKNYKMVVYYKDDIVQALQEHLVVENTLALQALLDIVVSLCIDLSCDFYAHFPEFFKILTSLLNTKDVEKLEWVFSCISMLFRKLWRYMVEDMGNVLSMYMGLFEGEHPQHISNFAAESVSFLLRKARNRELVFTKLFSVLVDKPGLADRMAHVIFNMVKTSQNQFHSVTEDLMPVIFSFLKSKGEAHDDIQSIFNCIKASIQLMADHTRKYCKPVWNALVQEIKDNYSTNGDLPYLGHLLELLNTWCKCRQCSRLYCHKEFCDVITTCQNLVGSLVGTDVYKRISDVVCNVTATVIQGSKSGLTTSVLEGLIRNLSNSDVNFNALVTFWETLFPLPEFQSLAHAPFLKFCKEKTQLRDNQSMIVKLIAKYSLTNNQLPINGEQLLIYKPCIFDFAMFSKMKSEKAIGEIVGNILKKEKDPEILWNALVTIQSVRPLAENLLKILTNLFKSLLKLDKNDKVLAVAVLCLQSLWVVHKSVPDGCKSLLKVLELRPNRLGLLAIDTLLSCNIKSNDAFDQPELQRLLVTHVSSPNSSVRNLSLRILRKLDADNEAVYSWCIMAEEGHATVHEYRSKLLQLKKLENHGNFKDQVKRVVIRCLFSQFYVNFSGLWQPLQEILTSYATSSRNDEFWEVLFEILEESSKNAELSKWWLQNASTADQTGQTEENEFLNFIEGKVKANYKVVNSRPDFFNFRLQIWKTMAILPHNNVIECNNRIIVTLLLQYLDNEHYLLDKHNSPSQSLDNLTNESEFCRKKDASKMLITMLEVFANFTNPGSTIQPDKLLNFYKGLLTHVHTEMQQAALKCIFTYKRKGVNKHKEQLMSFFDDKKFRDALTNFEVKSLSDEDRKVLVPILLRLLFGRMRSKTGASSGGKENSVARRSVIIRFLAGMEASEMKDFLNMVVEPFSAVVSSNADVMEIAEVDSKSLKSVPFTRQLGVIGTLQMLLTKLNKQLPPDAYSLILRTLLYVIRLNSLYLLQSTNGSADIEPKLTAPIKNIKKQAQECLILLLNSWPDECVMREVDVKNITGVNVWPDLYKLVNESSGHPTVLLKLLKVFAVNLRYVPWLAQYNSDATDNTATPEMKTPIHALVETLNFPKTSAQVSTFILDIFNDLLFGTEKDKESDEILGQITPESFVNSSLEINQEIKSRSELGLLLLQPHLISIVRFFIENMRKSKKGLTPASQIRSLNGLMTSQTGLNAWDKRFIEEMDFDSRLTAFNSIVEKLEKDPGALFNDSCIKFLPILHCSLHTMLHLYSDLSLRESVSRVLTLVVRKVKETENIAPEESKSIYKAIIKDFLLPSVQIAVKSKDEGCRHEAVNLLSILVKTFEEEPTLRGLSVLSNRTNPEDDFFENVRHIQMHRRSRALRKVAKILNENSTTEIIAQTESPISHTVAATFLLPLATQILFNQDLSKLAYLHDSCIDVIKSCAHIMPWGQYKRFLLQNIWNLDRSKEAIDIVCGIVQIFPFDLAKFAEAQLASQGKGTMDFPEIEQEDDTVLDDVVIDDKNKQDVCDETMVIDDGSDLSVETARNILFDVTRKLLPKLKSILASKDEGDEHKLSSAKTDIDNCKKKIPLAVAIVSVLKKMPPATLRSQLPSVVLKVVGFLRHKLHDVRIVACQTVISILRSLGPSYFNLVLKELKTGLARGYQRHVLVHALNAIFTSMLPVLGVGDLDSSLPMILEVLNEDLFGTTAAEKKVEKLRVKIPEARGRSKAYPAYKVIATFISKSNLTSVIEPLKAEMDKTNQHGIKKVIKDVLTEIGLGLLENKSMKAFDLLALIHSLVSENISIMFPEKNKKNDEEKQSKPGLRPPSCLLLPPNPERSGLKSPPKSAKSNLHLLVEFSLQLLHLSIKRQVVVLADQEHLELIDPLVPHVAKCLNSTHQQTVVDAIRCIAKLLRTESPSLHSICKKVISDLFKIMRDHTKGAGNQETAAVSFKCLSVLCSTGYGDVLTKDQLQVLLTYAEEDLYDTQRQSHAFELIKSILKKGLQCEEMVDTIKKVRNVAVQSHSPSSRAQARSLYFHFLMNYPLTTKKLNFQVEFILAQLTYEFEDGRTSALELVSSVISSFPEQQLEEHVTLLFISTSSVLLDDSTTCRKMASHVIKQLLKRLNSELKDQLFSFVAQWYASEEDTHQRLAALLVSIFAEVEATSLQRHLEDILPLLHSSIERVMEETGIYHALFFHLTALLRLLQHCGLSRGEKHQATLSGMLENVETLLSHPHAWVRLVCDQILGCVFSAWQPGELVAQKGYNFYLTTALEGKFESLTKKLFAQFECEILGDQLAEQLVKDLLFVVRVLQEAKASEGSVELHSEVVWLLRQLQRVTKLEQSNNPKVTAKRSAALKFSAAFSITFPQNPHWLLRELAAEVLEVVKQNSESEKFSSVYLKVVKKINHKKKERKRERDVQLVADPRKAAAFKLRKQDRTKQQRKRKIANLRPEY